MELKCKKCGSDRVGVHDKNSSKSTMRVKCRDCGHGWNIQKETVEPVPRQTNLQKPKIGMTLDQFRSRHDTDFIVENTLKKLDPDLIYEKQDIYKLCGISASTPGLSGSIESRPEYFGKIGGKLYFSHPDTIAELKRNAKLN